jgi:hypothetical protein
MGSASQTVGECAVLGADARAASGAEKSLARLRVATQGFNGCNDAGWISMFHVKHCVGMSSKRPWNTVLVAWGQILPATGMLRKSGGLCGNR